MKLLQAVDTWLEGNGLKKFVTEKNFQLFLVILAVVVGWSVGWSMTRVAVLFFVVFYILKPITSSRLAQLIILLTIGMGSLLFRGDEGRATSLALAIYILFIILVCRMLWDEWRNKKRV